MQCLKLLILALVQLWTPLRIPKWLLLLSLYEASREGEACQGWKRRYPLHGRHLALTSGLDSQSVIAGRGPCYY
jgi:hypothetical protein